MWSVVRVGGFAVVRVVAVDHSAASCARMCAQAPCSTGKKARTARCAYRYRYVQLYEYVPVRGPMRRISGSGGGPRWLAVARGGPGGSGC
eukprot:COSAG01_NODE_190_length_22595_cov_16.442301_9_plen_90_part_00